MGIPIESLAMHTWQGWLVIQHGLGLLKRAENVRL